MRIGVIGLGVMGSAMAANLLKARHRVHGYDISPRARSAFRRSGGVLEKSAAALAQAADVLIASLPSAEALHAVTAEISAGVSTKCRVVLETSTLPIEDKERSRATLAAKGIVLLDCPLSGTGAQARAKDLVVLASGNRAAFRKVERVLPGFSRSHYYLGEFGNGSRMKFVANLLVAIHNVSAAEALALGMKAGLDPRTVLKVIGDGAGSSRMFQVRGPLMVARRYRPATITIKLFQKDMKIIGEFAARHGVATPLFNASAAIYNAALAQGFAEQDTASVCAVLESLARVRRR